MTLFKSHSDFFYRKDLKESKVKIIVFLSSIWDYPKEQIHIYLTAFEYFRKYPHLFDGATMTEELPDIPGLDLDAMLHDYIYIHLGAAVSWKYQVKADRLFKKEMERRKKSSWNRGYRNTALWLKTPYFILRSRLKGRKTTPEKMEEMDRIFKTFNL